MLATRLGWFRSQALHSSFRQGPGPRRLAVQTAAMGTSGAPRTAVDETSRDGAFVR
jgi:hypothetical protein